MVRRFTPTIATTKIFLFDYNRNQPGSPYARVGQNARFMEKTARQREKLDVFVNHDRTPGPGRPSLEQEIADGGYDFIGVCEDSDLADTVILTADQHYTEMWRILLLRPTAGYHPAQATNGDFMEEGDMGYTAIKIAPDGHFSPTDVANILNYMTQRVPIREIEPKRGQYF